MAHVKRADGWHVVHSLCADPEFFFTRPSRPPRRRGPAVPKVYPTFPQIFEHEFHDHLYRLAIMSDLDLIIGFVDRLLAGRDFFCPRGQHIGYFKYKTILLTFHGPDLIGWAVRQKSGSLIHLLVDPEYRGRGIGSHLLRLLEPLTIRSKSDQSTGDPYEFYRMHGYIKTTDERIGKHKNIDLLSKQTTLEEQAPKTIAQS